MAAKGGRPPITDWQAPYCRHRVVAQIEVAKRGSKPNRQSTDPMEIFVNESTPPQLEEFIFHKSQHREQYISLLTDLLMHLRKDVESDQDSQSLTSDQQNPSSGMNSHA